MNLLSSNSVVTDENMELEVVAIKTNVFQISAKIGKLVSAVGSVYKN